MINFEGALNKLLHMSLEERERFLESISQNDTMMAARLRLELLNFQDLLKISNLHLMELFKSLPIEIWTTALRGLKKEYLVEFFNKINDPELNLKFDQSLAKTVNEIEKARIEIISLATQKGFFE